MVNKRHLPIFRVLVMGHGMQRLVLRGLQLVVTLSKRSEDAAMVSLGTCDAVS